MNKKDIKKTLENALFHGKDMAIQLYKYELAEMVDELKLSLLKDNDDYVFAVTVNMRNDKKYFAAMLLIEKSGDVHINEVAVERLQALWQSNYTKNMQQLIPMFADQLKKGQIPINGAKLVFQA